MNYSGISLPSCKVIPSLPPKSPSRGHSGTGQGGKLTAQISANRVVMLAIASLFRVSGSRTASIPKANARIPYGMGKGICPSAGATYHSASQSPDVLA